MAVHCSRVGVVHVKSELIRERRVEPAALGDAAPKSVCGKLNRYLALIDGALRMKIVSTASEQAI
jgi:hypothetical protein